MHDTITSEDESLTYRPRMKVLTRDQAWRIHQGALDILSRIGFQMEHEGVRQKLLAAGCTMGRDDRVMMPPELPEAALATAPREIVLYDQTGEPAMELAGSNFYFGTGSDTIFTHDLHTGQRRRTVLADTGNFARLVDGLENLDFAMSMGNPEDVPIDNIYVHVFGEMVLNTSKPIVFIADSGRDIESIWRIASAVAGGERELAERPFILNYSEAISPLRFPENVMDKLVFCAQKKIPICLPSGSNAGGGAPVTLAGAMALGIAENLVGLVIHQLTNPGAPFLFAPNVSVLDMRSTVVSYGCPEWSLTQAALADMRDEIYGLPIWAFAGASDSKVLDAQAGAEAMFSITTGMLSRANLMHDVGYMEFGSTSSLELVTMSNELVAMARQLVDGIPVNDDTLALTAIDRVATGDPNAFFLMDRHTMKHFRQAHFLPQLIDRNRFEAWEEAGRSDMAARCNAEAKRILSEHQPQEKPAAVLAAIEETLGLSDSGLTEAA